MKPIITILLILIVRVCNAQTHDTIKRYIDWSKPLTNSVLKAIPDSAKNRLTYNLHYGSEITAKVDTIPVLSYCCIDYNQPVFKWVKMYGLQGWDYPSVNFNGLMIYKQYLMDDRKTPAIYKVVYAIVRPKSKFKDIDNAQTNDTSQYPTIRQRLADSLWRAKHNTPQDLKWAMMAHVLIPISNEQSHIIEVRTPKGRMAYMTPDSAWHIKDTIGTINALVKVIVDTGQRTYDYRAEMENRISILQAQINSLKALIKERKKHAHIYYEAHGTPSRHSTK